MTEYALDIQKETAYARRWAFSRNPHYYDFDRIGGDCTNFVSQCIYAGGAVMNCTRDVGWYYFSLHDRAAAWTGVEYFYRFIVTNEGAGPYGFQVAAADACPGDVIQLGNGGGFYHSLFVLRNDGEPYVAAHTDDAFDRPLSSYHYERARCLHIVGARRY